MRLHLQRIDMRGAYSSDANWNGNIIDEETNNKVGFAEAARSPRRRHISLFDGKYQGDFLSQEECMAFAKGVESVLSHMLAVDEAQIETGEAA